MAKKTGKYAAILPRLKAWPGAEDPSYVDAVAAVKQEFLEPEPYPPNIEDLRKTIDIRIDTISSQYEKLHASILDIACGRRHASAFAAAYAEVRKLEKQVASWKSDVEVMKEAITQLFVDQAENEGIHSITLDTGRGVSFTLEPYPTVKDREAFRQWCLGQGLESQLTLHPSTMASLVKRMLADGEPEPPGVEVFSKPKMRLGGDSDE